MKKTVLFAGLISSIALSAQNITGITGSTNWLNEWTNFKPIQVEYPENNVLLSGIIDKDIKLINTKTYLLDTRVYVTKNATLTIEPGTIIRCGIGDIDNCGTLVITKGSKLIAEGTEKEPIIFTSNKTTSVRKPGNWGGIVILGNAPVNKLEKDNLHYLSGFDLTPEYSLYGGENSNDNSGIIKYVRIEFPGKKMPGTKELNALTLAGVGKSTVLDHIQVSYSNADAFQILGGEVNMNHLISFRSDDDDFDFSQGTQATLQNSLAIRHPFSTGTGNPRCLEIDTYEKPEDIDNTKKLTQVTAQNLTFLNLEDNSQGLVKESIYLKDNAHLTISNSVVSGFSTFLLLGEKIALNNDHFSKIQMKNVTLNKCKENIVSEEQSFNPKLKYWPDTKAMGFEINTTPYQDFFQSTDLKNNPDFRKKENATIVRN